ncbi:MAG: glutamate synthase subunit alpha, partial [Paramuribaculum sp.]|nr:glutamate synthase subunit alpha [Paramuribaculum sp.]
MNRKNPAHYLANSTRGMYDSRYEHDACGVGLLVNVGGRKSHRLIEQALQVLENMVHRGAEGADPLTGDGAGIMVQIPHEFILLQGVPVPEKGRYGTGIVFMPKDSHSQEVILDIIEREAMVDGMTLMAVRDVPVNNSMLGEVAKNAEPAVKQIFISDEESDRPMELRLYLLRKRIEKKISSTSIEGKDDFYICSLSSKTIAVYYKHLRAHDTD